jgi:putative transposase
VRTTIRDPHARPASDLVNRCFDRQQLNELWVGDITYIPTGEGWLYMSSVLDACSRRLLGWSLAGHMRTELVGDALEAAVGQRGGRHRISGVVFHGDHGSQLRLNWWSQHRLAGWSVDARRGLRPVSSS